MERTRLTCVILGKSQSGKKSLIEGWRQAFKSDFEEEDAYFYTTFLFENIDLPLKNSVVSVDLELRVLKGMGSNCSFEHCKAFLKGANMAVCVSRIDDYWSGFKVGLGV